MLNAAGKSTVAGAVAAVTLGSLVAPATAAAEPAAIAWKPCPGKDPVEEDRLKGLECGSLRVPLDHGDPDGERITLALTRAKATDRKNYQGVALLNRGGPGAHGRDMPPVFTNGLPEKVAATYDWIGFDPRGVGASKPALVCDKKYQDPGKPRADTVPASAAEEEAWTGRARAYAADCGERYGEMLPHMGSESWARDLDAIRVGLGRDQINYFGYSYGTYLGAVYATMFPGRVRRMVLDSVVRPSGVWYDNNLDQNVAFEKRIGAFFTWIARHDKTYKLGRTREAVAGAYTKARKSLKAKPAGGRVGASELDDLFLADGYGDYAWPMHARALSAYVVKRDAAPLRKMWKPPTWLDQNNYAVYNSVQCRDAAWPRDWAQWHADNTRLYRAGYRFETWGNAWYNAPCAFWAVPGGPPPEVQGSGDLAPPLLIQGTEDAATPYKGAEEMHGRLPGSRLLVQEGGGNHGVAMGGDECVDGAVADYLGKGELPADKPGPDAVCEAPGPPKPGASAERRPAAVPGDRPVREPVAAIGSRTS